MMAAMADGDIVESLRRVPLFAQLADKHLAQLAKACSERNVRAGEEVVV